MPVHSFWLGVRLIGATIGCFPLVLFGVVLGPTMFAVTLGYSVSEKVLLLWDRRLLADRKVEVNRPNTNCLLACELQPHSESIAVISRSLQ